MSNITSPDAKRSIIIEFKQAAMNEAKLISQNGIANGCLFYFIQSVMGKRNQFGVTEGLLLRITVK